jgi:predicted permease
VQSLGAALARLPGVDAAALSLAAPVLSDAIFMMPVEIPGHAPAKDENPPWFNAVSPNFFASTGVGLVAGREFDANDVDGREPVAIVNETFARRYFGGQNPIGRSITLALKTRRQLRIVGVAHDAQYGDVHAESVPMWYMPLDQALPLVGNPRLALTLRTSVEPVSVASTVRRAVVSVAPGANIRSLTSVGQLLDDALARERFAAALAAIFGVVALGLAAIGVYGVTSHSVARRTREIGIRMALGASPADALRLVMRQSIVVALVGVLTGAPLAVAANRGVASQLYGISPTDPRVVIGAAFALAMVAAMAALLPGRRAARVDPVVALRAE